LSRENTVRIDELTWIEVKALLDRGVRRFILPVGTLEPHGTHLPLGTDTIAPYAIALEVARRVNALVLPPIYYGVTKSLAGYPGAVRIEPSILKEYVYSILKYMALHGFKEAVIMNGHGGREQVEALDKAAFRIWQEYHIPVLIINWWSLARERGITQKFLSKEGGHGGSDETAVIYSVAPHLVKKHLYDENQILVYSSSIIAYPIEGTIINYSDKEGGVLFDETKSKKYFNMLVNEIAKVVDEYFQKVSFK